MRYCPKLFPVTTIVVGKSKASAILVVRRDLSSNAKAGRAPHGLGLSGPRFHRFCGDNAIWRFKFEASVV